MPTKKDLVFVGVQAILLAGLLFDPIDVLGTDSKILKWLGGLLCLISVGYGLLALFQLGSSLTPWPSPRSGSELVTSGTYAKARHPIYASLILFGLGLAIFTFSPWRLLITIALYLLFTQKAKYEEALLLDRYKEYSSYVARVSRFGIPGL